MKKKIRRLIKKKPNLFFVACIATILFVASATLAWFASTDAKENEFKTDFQFKVNLVDKFEPPTEFFPEQRVDKKVTAKNTGDLDAFVRVMVFPVAVDQERIPLPVNSDVEVKYNNLNTTEWLDGEDGYFYYLAKLVPGEESAILFDGVTFTVEPATKGDYQDANFSIEVKSEAVDIRKSEYRYAWWRTERETPQTVDPLKKIDDTLQAILAE